VGRIVSRLSPELEAEWDRRHYFEPERRPRNCWTPVSKGDGSPSAYFWCPDCGALGSLLGHEIDAQGNVTPSVLIHPCGFHESGIRLEGWPP
jgi:hypothetical protein